MMMGIVYVLAVLLFAAVFTITRLPQSCSKALAIARQAMEVMADRKLDDDAKEHATQQAALNMLKQGGLITLKTAMTIAATLLPLWLADVMALSSWEDTSQFALRWDVLLITTIVMLAAWLAWHHWKAPKPR